MKDFSTSFHWLIETWGFGFGVGVETRAKTPPYTGYGSWDDSMGSVTHLIPKLPKKDGTVFFGGFCMVLFALYSSFYGPTKMSQLKPMMVNILTFKFQS